MLKEIYSLLSLGSYETTETTTNQNKEPQEKESLRFFKRQLGSWTPSNCQFLFLVTQTSERIQLASFPDTKDKELKERFRTLNKNSGRQVIQINDAVQHGLVLKQANYRKWKGNVRTGLTMQIFIFKRGEKIGQD